MKKIAALLLISLLIPTYSISQTISTSGNSDRVWITKEQLKEADRVFNEHAYLLEENTLLKEKINTVSEINKNLEQVDSLKTLNLVDQKKINDKLTKSNKRKNTVITGLGGGLLVTLLLLIF